MKHILILIATLTIAFNMNAQSTSQSALPAHSQLTMTMPVDGQFEFPELPYANDALEPVLSAETIEYHYGKHFRAYVNNLNKLIAGTEFEKMSLEEIVIKSEDKLTESQSGLFNNAGQALNHLLYFTQFKSTAENNRPTGKIAEAIENEYGSFDKFVETFNAAGSSLFGSGWVFLCCDKNGRLTIVKEANAGNPVTKGLTPLLIIDVWEHAYYIDYRNARASHLSAIWSIIDWNIIEQRYMAQ